MLRAKLDDKFIFGEASLTDHYDERAKNAGRSRHHDLVQTDDQWRLSVSEALVDARQ